MDLALGQFRSHASALRKLLSFYRFTFAHLRVLKANLDVDGNIIDQKVVDDAKTMWPKEIFELMNVQVEVRGKENLSQEEAHLFVGNHVSYLDIPLLFSIAPATFVAKKELAAWPIIGHCIKAADTLLLKRESADSRRKARRQVAEEV